MNIETILIYVSSIIGGLVVIVTTLAGIFGDKWTKEKKLSNKVTHYINIIEEILPSLIVKYEDIFPVGKGTEKETLVLNEIQKYCSDNGIEYNEELTKRAIENYINMMNKKRIKR